MEWSIELIAIILGTIFLTILISVLELRRGNPKRQELKAISAGFQGIVKDFKKSRTENKEKWYKKGQPRTVTEKDFQKVNALIEDYHNVQDKNYSKASEHVRVFLVRKSTKPIKKAVVVMLIIAIFLFINNYTMLSILVVAYDLSIQFNLLFFVLNAAVSLLIGALFGYFLYRTPQLKRDPSELDSNLTKKDVKKLSKLSSMLVGAVTPGRVQKKYFEEGVGNIYKFLARFNKLLIAGFVGLSLYLVYLTVISVELKSLLEILEIIFSTFIFFSLVYYMVIMKKVSDMKFEHFSMFFIVLGLIALFNLLQFNWKWYYYAIILGCSLFIGISGVLLCKKNKEIRSLKDHNFFKLNISNLIWLSYLFIDLTVTLLYALSLNFNSLDWSTFTFWIPLIYLSFSSLSILLYIRSQIKGEFWEVSKKRNVLYLSSLLISIGFSILMVIISTEIIGIYSALFLISSSILILIVVLSRSEKIKTLKNKIKKQNK